MKCRSFLRYPACLPGSGFSFRHRFGPQRTPNGHLQYPFYRPGYGHVAVTDTRASFGVRRENWLLMTATNSPGPRIGTSVANCVTRPLWNNACAVFTAVLAPLA